MIIKKAVCALAVTAMIAPAIAKGLDEKIRILDERIRQHEKQREDMDQDVKEYNELIRQKETGEQAIVSGEHLPEQSFEEAISHRVQDLANQLDLLAKRLSAIEEKVTPGVKPVTDVAVEPVVATEAPQVMPQPMAHVGANESTVTEAAKESEKGKTPGVHVRDTIATEKAEQTESPVINAKSPALAQYNQAMKLLSAGDRANTENAIEAFEDVITTYPDDEYAHKSYIHAGAACLLIKDAAKAESYFKAALTKPLEETNAVSARLGLAEALAQKNDIKGAADQLALLKKQPMTDDQKKHYQALLKTCK